MSAMGGKKTTWPAASLAAVAATMVAMASPASAAEPKPVPLAPIAIMVAAQWGDDTTGESGKASTTTGAWDPTKDNGSLSSVARAIGAQAVWGARDLSGRHVTGAGVTVAVIDTGVARVPGLDAAGKVVNGPDLSFDGQTTATRYVDRYGHGTHIAGIIAGRDATIKAGDVPDPKSFAGIAPDAQILNIKVGAADGGTDVTQVIAAIDWTVQHRRDNGMNVRVLNLAYGTHSAQSAGVDPLARAVENAWKAGIVVVTAAGNDGLLIPVLMPGVDPYVITVGAVDHMGTTGAKDDRVAAFSNGGDADRRPDVIAPGKSIVSLRNAGSFVDIAHPEGLVTGDRTVRFFRGSGTSQAAAVVSGAVALMLQAKPSLTPDQVKTVLRATADPLPLFAQAAMGAGVIDLPGALLTPFLGVPQTWALSTGLGSLDGSRGGETVVNPANGVLLTGQTDALGSAWAPTAWVAASSAGAAWNGGTWNGRTWAGSSWTAAGWAGVTWTGPSWSGIDWEASSWRSDSWQASSWRASSWRASSWRGFY